MDYSTTRSIQADAVVVKCRRLYRKLAAEPTTGVDKLDEEIIPFLNRLNRVRGVATVASCLGHDEDGDRQDFYVSCVVNQEGMTNLVRLVDVLNTKLAVGKYRNHLEYRYTIDIRLGVFTIRMKSDWENPNWKAYKKDFLSFLKI